MKFPPRAHLMASWPVIRQPLSLMCTATQVPVSCICYQNLKDRKKNCGRTRDGLPLGEGVQVCDGDRLRRLKLVDLSIGQEATNVFFGLSKQCPT